MRKLDYKISERYSQELCHISNKLNQLESGRIYEISGARMDGALATNIDELKKMLNDLLNKIQNDEQGTSERIGEIIGKTFL